MSNNPHNKHRERLRQMFLNCNPEKMPDHMILEFLLCYSIPRIDTNGIAHELIDRFGGLANALDAEIEELLKVPGIGENSALLLKTIPLLCNRYASNKLKPRVCFQSTQKAAEFFIEYYLSKNKEIVSALLLDNSGRLICHTELHEGAVNSSNVNARKLAQIALGYNAASVILAHNHPSGDPTPSDADLYTTKQLMKAFSGIDLNLRAHIVVAGDKYVDAVKVVEENAKYEVRYMAFRADELPPTFENDEESKEPTPPPAKKKTEPAKKRSDRKKKDTVPVEQVPLIIPSLHFENWEAKLTAQSRSAEAPRDVNKEPSPEETTSKAPPQKSQRQAGDKRKSAPKTRKNAKPVPSPDKEPAKPILTIPEAIRELEMQEKER